MHFGTEKIRDVLCCACRAARSDTLVATSATRKTRVQRGLGGTSQPHFFPEAMLIQSTKDLTCIHASTTSSSFAMLEQARR